MTIATRAAETRWGAAVSEASSLCPVSRLFAEAKITVDAVLESTS